MDGGAARAKKAKAKKTKKPAKKAGAKKTVKHAKHAKKATAAPTLEKLKMQARKLGVPLSRDGRAKTKAQLSRAVHYVSSAK